MVLVIDEKFAPILNEMLALRFFLNPLGCCNRIDEMKIGMGKFLVFYAGRANPAGVVAPVGRGAVDHLRIGNGKRQFVAGLRTKKKLGMTHALIENCLDQLALDDFIAGDLTEFHKPRCSY